MKGCSPCRSRRSGTGIGGGCGWLQFMLVWTLLLSLSGLARGFTIEPPSNAVAGNKTAITYLQAETDPDSFTVQIVNAQNVVQASFPTTSTPPANGDPLQITLTLGTAFPPGTYTYQFFASNVPHRLAVSAPFTVAPAVTVTTSTSSASTTAPPQTSMVMSMSMSTLSLSSATFTTVPPSSTGATASDTGAISSSSVNTAVVAVAIIVSLLALALVTALVFYVSRRRRLANFDAAGSGSSWWQRGKHSMFVARPWVPPTPGADADVDVEKGGVRDSYIGRYGATGQAEMAMTEAEADLQRNETFGTTVISHARQSSNFLPPPTARRSRYSNAVLADEPYGVAVGSMPPSPSPPAMRERGAAGNLTVNVGAPDHRVSLPVTATPTRTYSVISPAIPPAALQPGSRPSWIYGRAGPAGLPRTSRVVWTLSVDGMTSSIVPPPRPLTPSDEHGESGPSDEGAIMHGDTESSLSLDAILREYDVASVHNSIEGMSMRRSFDSRSVAGPTEAEDTWSEHDDDREDVSDAGSIDSREPLSERPPEAPTTTRRGPSFRFSLASIFTTSGSSHRNNNSRPASGAIRRLPNPPLDQLVIPDPDSATFGSLAPGGPSTAKRSSMNRGFKFPSPIEAPTPTVPSRALISPRPLPPIPSPSSAPPSSSRQQMQPFALSPNTPATSATPTARTRPPLPALPIPPALPPAAVTAPFRPHSGAITPFDRRSMRTSVMSHYDSPGGASALSTNSIHGAEVLLAHWQSMNRVDRRLTTLDEKGQHRGPSPAPSTVDERW